MKRGDGTLLSPIAAITIASACSVKGRVVIAVGDGMGLAVGIAWEPIRDDNLATRANSRWRALRRCGPRWWRAPARARGPRQLKLRVQEGLAVAACPTARSSPPSASMLSASHVAGSAKPANASFRMGRSSSSVMGRARTGQQSCAIVQTQIRQRRVMHTAKCAFLCSGACCLTGSYCAPAIACLSCIMPTAVSVSASTGTPPSATCACLTALASPTRGLQGIKRPRTEVSLPQASS